MNDPGGRSLEVGGASLDGVLHLLDARTSSRAAVRPAKAGLLLICAHVPAGPSASGISGLRVLLTADLLTRIAEMGNLQALTVLATGKRPARYSEAATRLVDGLGIHPPAARAGCGEAHTAFGGPVDVHLVSGAMSIDDDQGGLVVRVGATRIRQADTLEPLAVRYALMSVPYHQPADITEVALAGARETLGSWRCLVANWAERPSRPIPSRITGAVKDACSDLDMGAVLALLGDLAVDAGVPDGAKFEGFLYADRVLGLELAREIGQPARSCGQD
jgi:hypothetical protein